MPSPEPDYRPSGFPLDRRRARRFAEYSEEPATEEFPTEEELEEEEEE